MRRYLEVGHLEDDKVMKSESSWTGLVPLQKEAPESSPVSSPEDTEKRSRRLWTRKWALSRQGIGQYHDLGLPNLQICEK